MRLLINAIPLLGQQTGIGNYTRQIAKSALAMPSEVRTTFFYGYYSDKLREPAAESKANFIYSIKNLAKKATLIRRVCKKGVALGNVAYNFIRRRNLDCYFEPNFLLLPAIRAARNVITVHDFSCFLYPQWHPAERVRQMETNLWKSVERADKIITVSESIRKQAIEQFGLDEKRLVVIPNGVDHSLFHIMDEDVKRRARERYDLPENFILFVGTLEPRKNLSNLLLAYALLPHWLKLRFPLLLAGSNGWKNAEIMRLMRDQGRYVRFMGYMPENDLAALYGCASLFVYPSWYEGFGLPVLEAMACGCPVLASTDPALMELANGAALHTPAAEVEKMRNVIHEMLEDEKLRRELAQKGLAQAARFDWRKSASDHLRLFRDVCSC